jgi:phosphate starvation-inducible PhoH-like protein
MQGIIRLGTDKESLKLFGHLDENLKFAEEHFNVKAFARGRKLHFQGDAKDIERATQFFKNLLSLIRQGQVIDQSVLAHLLHSSPEELKNAGESLKDTNLDHVFFHKGRSIKPKSKAQEEYVMAINQYDIVFGIGPAGTGKTYLAMAQAVNYLKKRRVSRILLTRPAVEAGESLGFLPGDLYAKLNPYLRPLYDALYEMMEIEEVTRNLQRGVIEVAPLAYMRGRTLNDAFIILDEAQNSTPEQMKMFLTRLGFNSKAVITGDVTQVDLPSGRKSGLIEVQSILSKVSGINFSYLTRKDVVRHRLVQDIIEAYEKKEK